MLHAQLALRGEDPGLGVGGVGVVGGGRAAGGGRRVGVRLLPLSLQHGENGLLTVHPRGFC